MEIRVYDGLNKRLGWSIAVALAVRILAAFSTFLLASPQATGFPAEANPVLIVAVVMTLAVFAIINLTTSPQIRVKRVTGEVFRLDFLCGREVRRKVAAECGLKISDQL